MAGKLDAVVILLLLLLLLKNSMTNLHGKLGPTLLPKTDLKTDPYSAKKVPVSNVISFFFSVLWERMGIVGRSTSKETRVW